MTRWSLCLMFIFGRLNPVCLMQKSLEQIAGSTAQAAEHFLLNAGKVRQSSPIGAMNFSGCYCCLFATDIEDVHFDDDSQERICCSPNFVHHFRGKVGLWRL